MSEIIPEVILKKEGGESISVLEKYVGLHSRAEGMLTINFKTPEAEMNDLKEFFESFQNDESLKVDIGGTGDIECSFKGMSPILPQTDNAGFPYFTLSVTLQDINKMKAYDDKPGCGCG
jgi:hypothetical protein